MVTDFRALRLGWLGRADVHAAVDQHRVRTDHLGSTSFHGKPPNQPGGEARLAGRGRAHQHYGHLHSVAQP
jgi:hypothetical protein